ncbi:MAG: HlyD family efflux transporter periplasmic adaptor subunit [Bacteroidales bacterium]|nr:HlyD family efflux transporter periplasmic adaptor subunit [Bacteroidales bacterium]
MKRTIIHIIMAAGLIGISSCTGQNEKSDAYGNFEAREIIVSAQSQGELLRLDLQEGETLKPGMTVGWIDTSTLAVRREQVKAKQNSLDAKISNIEAQADVQQEQINTLLTEKRRIERLLKEEAATERQWDNITGQLNVARKKLKSIRTQKQSVYSERQVLDKQLQELKTQINHCRIVNPIRGTVLEKYLEPFEIAAPGKAIYKIADLSQMTLRVYVSGAQLPDVKIGQQVEVLVDKNQKENQHFSGTVTWISPEAEFTPKIIQTKEERVDLVYAVKVRVNNDGTIKIGMPGEVNFTNKESHASSNS